jgi:hypothetical protein
MGAKRNCMPSSQLWASLIHPSTLDANLEGLEAFETSAKDGHASNPKKQKKYDNSNVN